MRARLSMPLTDVSMNLGLIPRFPSCLHLKPLCHPDWPGEHIFFLFCAIKPKIL